jgi:predicted RNA-binding protein with PIN domain
MSLVYIVDGYNVIKRSSRLADKQLRAARSEFFSYLERYRPHGARANKLIVVFDGSTQVFGYSQDCSFDVIFSQGETADDKIKALVVSMKQPKNVVVVTDDKGLGLSVRSCGAHIMPTAVFMSKGSAGKKERHSSSFKEDEKIDLSIVERENITAELKRIWLNKK